MGDEDAELVVEKKKKKKKKDKHHGEGPWDGDGAPAFGGEPFGEPGGSDSFGDPPPDHGFGDMHDVGGGGDGFGALPGDGFGALPGDGFGDPPGDGFGGLAGDGFGDFPGDGGGDGGHHFGEPLPLDEPEEARPPHEEEEPPPREEEEAPAFFGEEVQEAPSGELLERGIEEPTSRHEALAGDREVSAQLRQEADELAKAVLLEQEQGRALEAEVQARQEECERLREQEQQLLEDVHAAKARLEAARHEHRSTDLESLVINTDRHFAGQEMDFLARKAEGDQLEVESMLKANELLERHTGEVVAHMTTLDKERKNVLYEAAQEREVLRQEERQAAELRNKADRMRRDVVAIAHGSREALQRSLFSALDEPDARKGGSVRSGRVAEASAAKPAASAPEPRRPEGNSWAQSIFSPNRTMGGGSPGSGADLSPASPGANLIVRPPGADLPF